MAKLGKEEGPEFFRDSIVYREWGYRLASYGKYAPAIACFEKAIEQAERDDLRALLGLCKTQVNYTRYQGATETSERCMNIEPNHYQVKYMRLEALFNIGEFSYSLVHAHQGLRLRRIPFEYGVCQGNETIEDCVGRNTHPKALLLLYPWIRKLEDHRKALIEKLEEEEDEFEGIDEEQSRFKVNDPIVRGEAYLRKLRRVIAKIYLGYLARDKEFLQEIMEYPDKVESPNKKSSAALRAIATTCYGRSVRRQEILRMRRPLYVMLLERKAIPKGHLIMMEEEKQLRRNNIIIEADYLLRRLHDVRMSKDYPTFFRLVDRVKDKFDSYSDTMFPLKQRCLNAVYNMVAWVYIDTRDLTRLDTTKAKTRYLKHHLGIRVAELPRDSDIAWIPAPNRKETLRVFRRRLAMASEKLELAWIYHEFAKYLIDIGRFDLARFYAKKARDAGQETGSEQWVLNSNHLTLRIEISQNNRNEAREAGVMALSDSKGLGIDFLVDFYKRAIVIVDDMDIEKMLDFDGIAVRQQLILDLMPEEMKSTVDFLWRSMEVVPAKRRLSVMPGCKPVDRKFKLPCRRRTILPSPPKDPEREARMALIREYEVAKERPGYMDFHEYE